MKLTYVIPDLIRNLYKLIPLFILFVIFSSTVFADSRSDYDYQYSKYRQNFSEFSLYKKDYLTNPTLDNQQKALLTGKSTISTRDLTRASFSAYLRDLIMADGIKYEPMNPVLTALIESQQFFLSEAGKGQSLVTLANFDEFNTNYLSKYEVHVRSQKVGIVAHKITKLKYLSLQQTKALSSLKEKIPSEKVSVRVTERIASLETDLDTITKKIDNLATYLTTEESLENATSEVFFNAKVETLAEIRTLQLAWMDQLIDLDLNYGKI